MVQGIFDQRFFGHWLKMALAGLGDAEKAVLIDGKRAVLGDGRR